MTIFCVNTHSPEKFSCVGVIFLANHASSEVAVRALEYSRNDDFYPYIRWHWYPYNRCYSTIINDDQCNDNYIVNPLLVRKNKICWSWYIMGSYVQLGKKQMISKKRRIKLMKLYLSTIGDDYTNQLQIPNYTTCDPVTHSTKTLRRKMCSALMVLLGRLGVEDRIWSTIMGYSA